MKAPVPYFPHLLLSLFVLLISHTVSSAASLGGAGGSAGKFIKVDQGKESNEGLLARLPVNPFASDPRANSSTYGRVSDSSSNVPNSPKRYREFNRSALIPYKFSPDVQSRMSARIMRAAGSSSSRIYARGSGVGSIRMTSKDCDNSDRWMVATATNDLKSTQNTQNLVNLANMKGWCLCIVLDSKSSTDFNYLNIPNAVVLTVEKQQKLAYRILPFIPWNHFGRKNVGFIYAIHHGAKLIYDTDDNNFVEAHAGLPGNLSSLEIAFRAPAVPAAGAAPDAPAHSARTTEALASSTSSTIFSTFNPYPLFGIGHSWPRGFPSPVKERVIFTQNLPQPTESQQVHRGSKGPAENICVLQSLANVNPDMGISDRSTRDTAVYFEKEMGANLLYPQKVFVPFNAQATLITSDVFCSIMLPVTVPCYVSDIWRSYFMQHEMWDRGCHVAFASPLVKQYRKAHKYRDEVIVELQSEMAQMDLSNQAGQLLEALSLTSMHSGSCFDRVIDIYISMYEFGIVELQDVLMAWAFTHDVRDALDAGFPSTSYTSSTTDAILQKNLDKPQAVLAEHAPDTPTGVPEKPPAADNGIFNAAVPVRTTPSVDQNQQGAPVLNPATTVVPPLPTASAPSPSMPRATRAAVCITGPFSFGLEPIHFWRQTLFPWIRMPCDVFLAPITYDSENFAQHALYNNVSSLLSSIPSVTNVQIVHNAYNLSLHSLHNDMISKSGYEEQGFHDATDPSWESQEQYLIQLNGLQACWDAVSISSNVYTHVVRQKADSYLLAQVPAPLHSPFFTTPTGASVSILVDSDYSDIYGQDDDICVHVKCAGVHDRYNAFAFGNMEGMKAYLTVLPELRMQLVKSSVTQKKYWAFSLFSSSTASSKNARSILQEHLSLHNVSVHLITHSQTATESN